MLIDYIHTIFVTANFLTAELILHLASVSLRSDWLGDKLSPSVLLQTGSVFYQVQLY